MPKSSTQKEEEGHRQCESFHKWSGNAFGLHISVADTAPLELDIWHTSRSHCFVQRQLNIWFRELHSLLIDRDPDLVLVSDGFEALSM